MAIRQLTTYEKELLRQVVVKHRPNLLGLVDSIDHIVLTAEQREEMREAIADEFVTELDSHSEPTQRGIILDHLIDSLWHISEDAVPQNDTSHRLVISPLVGPICL